MSKLVKIDEINVDFESVSIDSPERKVKKILNSLLYKLPTYNKKQWEEIAEKMGTLDTIFRPINNQQNIYKVGLIELLKMYALENWWHFAKDGNKIYFFVGELWVEVEVETMKYFLELAAIQMGVPQYIASEAKFVENIYTQLLSSSFFEKMIKPSITLLNLQNGTLKIGLDGVSLEPFSYRDFLTHQLDFEYDVHSHNKLWLSFLDTVLPDKDTQKTLQQSIGYLFIKDLKLEKAIFLYGTGSNGKSVIFEVLKGIISTEMMTNYSLESLCDAKGYHRANINNKLVNYGTDISMKNIEHGVFKQMVSGEPIEVRQIYEKPFVMHNYAKLIFNLNKIDDADTESTIGFFRRMVFIPFEKTIEPEQQDKTLHKKILAEKAGILNWIIEGILEVIKNQEIFVSTKCKNFIENFKKESNIVIRFVDDTSFQHSTLSTNTTSFQLAYDKFCIYCKEQGEKAPSQRIFNNELKKLKFQSVRRATGNVWMASFSDILI